MKLHLVLRPTLIGLTLISSFMMRVCYAAPPAPTCNNLKLNAGAPRFETLAQGLYPESRDKVMRLLKDATTQDAPQSCESLMHARDFLARLEGPRVIDRSSPDPKIYPKRFEPCRDAKVTGDSVEAIFRKKESMFYPKARKQISEMIAQGKKESSCLIFDEIRNYIVDLWPETAKQLK